MVILLWVWLKSVMAHSPLLAQNVHAAEPPFASRISHSKVVESMRVVNESNQFGKAASKKPFLFLLVLS